MIQRLLNERITEDLSAFRVLNIKGARQSGKTTMVGQLANSHNFKYFTFDDVADLNYARQMPLEFVRQANDNTVVIDEIQMMPELLPYIKIQVDRNNRPGQFIITGSADLIKMSKVSESLAGRSVDYELMPLSVAELTNSKYNIIDLLLEADFENHYGNLSNSGADIVFEYAAKGGFPEVQNLTNRQRSNWFKAYIQSRVIKDLQEISLGGLSNLKLLPRMLRYLSWQAGDLLNYSSVANSVGMDSKTIKSYVIFFETLFIAKILQPYFVNIAKRQIKTPKFYFSDSGLLAHFLNVDSLPDIKFTGKIVENFLFNELLKGSTMSKSFVDFYFYRDKAQYEVDFLIEYGQGEVVAIEVKAKENLSNSDFGGIRKLKRMLGDKLIKAYVFYLGRLLYPKTTEEGIDIIAMPFSILKGF